VLQLKNLEGRDVGEKVTAWDGRVLGGLEHGWHVARLNGWEEQNEMEAGRGGETGGRGCIRQTFVGAQGGREDSFDSRCSLRRSILCRMPHTGEDSMRVTTG
jgi:hypothetical protein